MGSKRVIEDKDVLDLSKINLGRLAHDFLYKTKSGEYSLDELNSHIQFLISSIQRESREKPVYNVGVLLVCVNFPYWQYALPVINGIKGLFLPGHNVELLMWSDMPQYPESKGVSYGTTIFPIESIEWPYPTLMRYHYFLQQEKKLREYDYLFYIDLDMRIVNVVGDEILGEGLTAAQHPMYAIRKEYIPPYEPNPSSSAYIPRPGRILEEDSKYRFEPLYLAGGFQGGKSDKFICAMKEMQATIDSDLDNGYVAIWNDETHWNKYLFDNPPSVVLSPAYVYPDSLIQEYYQKIWGRNYTPRIVTLTKPFSLSKEGGLAAQKMVSTS